MKMVDYILDADFIDACKQAGACAAGLEWLRAEPRTWLELVAHRQDWAVWAMTQIDCKLDLEGLESHYRAHVMASRKDCPIDLTGLGSVERASVMASREDCPIDLDGLSPFGRSWVIRNRGLEDD